MSEWYNIDWQPFKKFGIIFRRNKSTQEYEAIYHPNVRLDTKYSPRISKNKLLQLLMCSAEDYILNKGLQPIKTDEEDIL